MSLSSPGIGSNLDVQGIVSQLMALERRPLVQLRSEVTRIDAKISAYGKIKSALSTLQDAARKLTDLSTWQAARASSSDETALRATATPGAPQGNFSVTVDALAKRQTVATAQFASADTVLGAGTLRVQLGSYDAGVGSFSADPARPETAITIAADATLADIRNAINEADAGVTALLVNDGDQVRLMLRSEQTGSEQAFRITADDANLAGLAFDPGAPLAGSTVMTQAARDAAFWIDGLELSGTDNELGDVVDGLTLELRREGPDAVEVLVEPDREEMRKAVDGFIEAYNALNSLLNEQTRYDDATKVAGTLQGERSALLIQSRLRDTLRSTVAGLEIDSLSAAGIEVLRDGSLSVKESLYEAAAADPERLAQLFTASSADPAAQGLAVRLNTQITDLLGIEGAVTVATETWQSRRSRNEDRQESLEYRLTQTEASLLRTYSELDRQLAQMLSTSNYLTANLPKTQA